jgi:hypothetical protein
MKRRQKVQSVGLFQHNIPSTFVQYDLSINIKVCLVRLDSLSLCAFDLKMELSYNEGGY